MERPPSGTFKSFFIICLLVVVMTAGMLIAMDITCQQRYHEFFVYPNARLVRERHDFVNAYGIGTTWAEYFTPDSPREVNIWFTAGYNRSLEELQNRNTSVAAAPPRNWEIEATLDGGSRILIRNQCPW